MYSQDHDSWLDDGNDDVYDPSGDEIDGGCNAGDYDGYGETVNDPKSAEMFGLIVTDRQIERWVMGTHQSPIELKYLMTAHERKASERSRMQKIKKEPPTKYRRHAELSCHRQTKKDLHQKHAAMAKKAVNYQTKLQALHAHKCSRPAPTHQPETPARSTSNGFQITTFSTLWSWMGSSFGTAGYTTPKPKSNHSASQCSGGTERRRQEILDAIQ